MRYFLPALVLVSLAPFALAVNLKGLRESANIEDRRHEKPIKDVYGASIQQRMQNMQEPTRFLLKLGEQADKNAFPFFCHSFKNHRGQFSQLAAEIKRAKPLSELFWKPGSALAKGSATKGVNACEGAKQEAELKASAGILDINAQKAGLLKEYGQIREHARQLLRDMEKSKGLVQSMVDKLNRDCEPTANLTADQLTDYLQQHDGFLKDLDTAKNQIGEQRQATRSINCGADSAASPKN
jgi:hypothetical protein